MKRILGLMLLTLIIFSCEQAQNDNRSAHSDLQSQNLALINQYFVHFNEDNWKKMAEMYDEAALFKDPSFGIEPFNQSQGEIIEKYAQLSEVIPDLYDEVTGTYASGADKVIVEFISTGTTPDGQSFKLPICTIFTIKDGKITKDFTYYDNFDESGD